MKGMDFIMNSASDIWTKILDLLRKDLTETAITTWFDECSAIEFAGTRLIIHTPTTYKKDVIEERFLGTIKSALADIFSSSDFDVIVLDDDGLKAMNEDADSPGYLGTDEYTFEHFVVGNSNKLAHAAALAVTEVGNKNKFNPLFIYGASGLGKTHLLYAIRHAIESKYPHYNTISVKGEDFANDLITAILQGKDKNLEFREKYRGADFFLMDDVQFIAGKKQTQEELFHTFNTLLELGKQIVFTSDRPPSELYILEDRIKGRFESGLLVDVQPPDDALRVAIIKRKAEQQGVVLPQDVIFYISDTLDSNVRQLEGAVKWIIACRDLMDDDITVESVKKYLKERFKGEKDLIPTATTIIDKTAKSFMLTPEDIKGRSQTSNIVLARQVAMYLIRKMTNLSLKDTGDVFNRDHTTVISSINKVERIIREDDEFSNKLKDISSNINSIN